MAGPSALRPAPLLAVLGFALGLAGFYVASADANGGEFTFALDDSYIHLGIARHFVEHGVWGVSVSEVASATSSPLWTALLAAAFAGLGPQELLALALNGLAGIALLSVVWRDTRSPLALVGILALGPLPYLAALGMEHVLHALLVILLVREALHGRLSVAILLAFLAALTRYESLFVAAAIAAVLASEGRWRAAVVLPLSAVSGVGLYGLLMTLLGGLPIPNSLIMKSAIAGGWERLWQSNVGEGVVVLVLLVAALGLAERGPRREAYVFAIAGLLHLSLARMGWLWRYEGYLVIWGLTIVAPLVRMSDVRHVLLATVVAAPMSLRAVTAITHYVPAARAIHDGDRLLASVVTSLGGKPVIAVHDVGALSWFTDANIVDLAGLGTNEVARRHLAHELDADRFAAIMEERGAVLAYADSGWMAILPPNLTSIATLEYEIPGGGRARTRIFATPRTNREVVAEALRSLPAGGERYRITMD